MRTITLLIGLALITSAAHAEELLKKNGGNYLGRKKSSEVFVTCDGGEIKIAPGTVESTPRICSRAVDMGVVEITGIKAGTVTVKDSNNTEIEYKVKASEREVLRAPVGTSIKVSGTTEQNRKLSLPDGL